MFLEGGRGAPWSGPIWLSAQQGSLTRSQAGLFTLVDSGVGRASAMGGGKGSRFGEMGQLLACHRASPSANCWGPVLGPVAVLAGRGGGGQGLGGWVGHSGSLA